MKESSYTEEDDQISNTESIPKNTNPAGCGGAHLSSQSPEAEVGSFPGSRTTWFIYSELLASQGYIVRPSIKNSCTLEMAQWAKPFSTNVGTLV